MIINVVNEINFPCIAKEKFYIKNNQMKRILIFFLFILFFASQQNVTGQISATQIGVEHQVRGKIRIKLKRENLQEVNSLKALSVSDEMDSFGIESLDQVSRKNGIIRITRVFPFSLKDEAKHREYGLHLWFELDFDESMNSASIVDQYSILDEVAIAKPLYKKTRIDNGGVPVRIDLGELKAKNGQYQTKALAQTKALTQTQTKVSFDDPLLVDQWHYNNTGEIAGTVNSDISLFEAWTKQTGSSDVIVAIVDGGVDTKHEDLIDNLWVNEAEMNGTEGIDDDGNGYVDDYHGFNFVTNGVVTADAHGTHVAGTVAAVNNNGKGVAGVAGGDGSGNGVRLMSCQVFNDNGSGNFAAAIVYGADNGAVIAQNSWGYTMSGYYEPEVYEAILYFNAEAGQYEGSPMKGGLCIFAAGNTGTEEDHYPGAFDECLSVTATGPSAKAAPYSTYGKWADVAAPGGDQYNFGEIGGVLSTLPNNGYGYMQGTSMACPHVSGVAGLAVSQFADDNITREDLRKILVNSNNRFTFEHHGKFGSGIIDAELALSEDAKIAPEVIDDLEAVGIYHNGVELAWSVPKDEDNFQPTTFYLAVSTSEITADNFDGQTVYQLANPFGYGLDVSVTLGALMKQKDYWFAVKSADRYENISEISNIIQVTTTDAPHFMESSRYIKVDIDASVNATKNIPLTFSNIGEGIIDWFYYVGNERLYWELEEEVSEKLASKVAKAAKLAQNPELAAVVTPLAVPVETIKTASTLVSSADEIPDYWKYDNTQFVAGMSHAQETGNNSVMGTGTPQIGLSCATRFDMKHGETFNLTHIEAALLFSQKEKPLIVELKAGSELESAKRVYISEHYVQNTDVFDWVRIPIYRPQRFEDTESFWVVLHFPEEEKHPMGFEYNYYKHGYFLMSGDNGRSYMDIRDWIMKPYIPLLRVASTGDDGSYVFMNPPSGKIGEGESKNINVTIDANQLSNGLHLASVGIVTNDVNKRIVSIEVKANVTGQKSKLNLDKAYKFEISPNKDNNLTLSLENKGLAALEIYDIRGTGVTSQVTDTIVIYPDYERNVPFIYNTDQLGVISGELVLETNEGDIRLSSEMFCKNSALLQASLNTNEITISNGQAQEVELSLTNISSDVDLEYDLKHYDSYNAMKDKTSGKIRYEVLSSDDPNGPEANQWEDISDFGTINNTNKWYIGSEDIDLKMKFPLFNEVFDHIGMCYAGMLNFHKGGYYSEQLPDYRHGWSSGSGAFPVFLANNINTTLVQGFQYYFYGDRAVFNIKLSGVNAAGNEFNYEGQLNIEAQVVLFNDGAVEYRYKKVENLVDGVDYIVALLGLAPEDFAAYRNLDQPENKIHEGLVVRFEPVVDISLITNADTKLGLLKPGESANVKLTVDPERLGQIEGTYYNQVEIKSNTLVGIDSLPLTINIVGDPQFQVKDSIVFGKCNVGFEVVEASIVSNIGRATGSITGVSFNYSDFTCEETFPIQIQSNSHYRLPIIYTPSSDDYLSNIMTVNFDNGQREEVIITGSGKVDPEFVINLPSDISVDLNGGEAISVPFSINSQDTGSEVDYSFLNSVFASVVTDGNLKGEGNNNEALTEDYGYTWEISDSLRTYHKWEDISDNSELLKPTNGSLTAVKLPFSFPFYGDLYDTIWVSENGYVTVVEPVSDKFWTEFEKNDGMRGLICPLKAPLQPSTEDGGVMCLVEEDRIILQWDHFLGEIVEMSGSPATFQLEMLADGTIYFHYNDIARYAGLELYGLESPDESEVLVIEKAYILIWSNLSDHSTYAINPPLKGQVASGQTTDFELLISAENIYHSGVYKDTVELLTSSLAQPTISIPVSLNVSGNPILDIEETQTWENVIFTDDLILNRKIKIANYGFETAEITSVAFDQLDGLTLKDHAGNEILKSTAGALMNSIQVLPWEVVEIELIIPVDQNEDVEGQVIFGGNFDTTSINIIASVVNSPVFGWNGVDKVYEDLNNSFNPSFSFTIENRGDSPMDYNLVPAIIPSGDSGSANPGIIEEVGNYTTDAPEIIKSLNLDWKDVPDGTIAPMVGGTPLAFSNEFVVPDEGMFITHIKIWNNLRATDEYVRIMLHTGGDKPQEGELIYEQKYIIKEPVVNQWVYFPLKTPVQVDGGTKLFVTSCQPLDYKYVGFDVTSDESLRARSWDGIYSGQGVYRFFNQITEGMDYIFKIRPVTAGGSGLWLELDHLSGKLEGGSSVDVNASINAALVEGGVYSAKVLVTTNDINHRNDEFKVDITVNGTPTIKFRPNQYQECLKITETEELLVSYLIEDAEGDDLSISMENEHTELTAKFTQTGDKTAQVEFSTTYESAGRYEYPVEISDAAGNVVRDTIVVEVKDVNRAPVFNPEFGIIRLNLADPLNGFTIDPAEMFTDPDGDEFQLLAGNYTPEICDLAMGYNYMDVHPLQEGTGFLVFGADDGKEGGFVVYGSYVVITNDADAVQEERDGFDNDDPNLLEEWGGLKVYPNPVTNEVANIHYELEEDATVSIDLYDMTGRKLSTVIQGSYSKGVYKENVNVSDLPSGVYFCILTENGQRKTTCKIVIK